MDSNDGDRMTTVPWRRRAMLVTIAAIVLAACTGSRDADPSDFLPTADGVGASYIAGIQGPLSIDLAARCVTIGDLANGGSVVVWPDGWWVDSTDPDDPYLVSASGKRFADGDDMILGGGRVGRDRLSELSAYDHLTFADLCGADTVWVMHAAP